MTESSHQAKSYGIVNLIDSELRNVVVRRSDNGSLPLSRDGPVASTNAGVSGAQGSNIAEQQQLTFCTTKITPQTAHNSLQFWGFLKDSAY